MANQFIYSFLLLIAATASTYAADIQDGSSTTISERPYVVALQAPDGTQVCGGALIDSINVVTTASCVTIYDLSGLVVSVNNGAETVEIAKSKFNPNYDPVTNQNDVAVLKLEEPVSADPINLAGEQPAAGTSGIVTGWNTENQQFEITKSFITTEDCLSGNYGYTEDDELGAVVCGIGAGCGGQTGDPYVVNNQLVGLAFMGYGCSNKNNLTVFTDISAFRSWIESTSQNL